MTRPEEGTYDVEHDQIASITFTSVPKEDGIEFYIEMHDSSAYGFTAYTPAQLTRIMEKNGWLSFVDLDTLIIKEPTMEAIKHALAQVLLLDVTHFGIQINEAESEEWESDPWASL